MRAGVGVSFVPVVVLFCVRMTVSVSGGGTNGGACVVCAREVIDYCRALGGQSAHGVAVSRRLILYDVINV